MSKPSDFAPDEHNVDETYASCTGVGPFRDLQFEVCEFRECNFENAKFENISFIDCQITDTDLSLAEVYQCVFNGVIFERCRLRGVDWTRINASLLSLEFNECVLDYGNFENLRLKKSAFRKCSIHEASFDRADLRQADFTGSNLDRTTFDGADLRKADFRDTEQLTLGLGNCRHEGLRLRLSDAKTTLTAHGFEICP